MRRKKPRLQKAAARHCTIFYSGGDAVSLGLATLGDKANIMMTFAELYGKRKLDARFVRMMQERERHKRCQNDPNNSPTLA